MDLRSTSRQSRSRSNTPFSLGRLEQDILKENHIEHSISRNTRRVTTTTVKTSNGSNTFDSLNEEQNIHSRYVKPTSSKRVTRSAKFYKTSDYSSEEGENEVSSTRTISDNERNRMLEDAKKAADNPSGITALGLYRRAKRYWDEYPKTDWTYSPFSKDRVEIAPGVVAMPNMSRRHISSYNRYTNTDVSAYSVAPQRLFSETSQQRTTIVSIVTRIVVSILIFVIGIAYACSRSVYYVYSSAHSVSLMTAKKIHRLVSWVMLLDTWFLRKRTNNGKAASLLALCLIPLLLVGGWWFFSNMGENIYGALVNSSSIYPPLELSPEQVITTSTDSFNKHYDNNRQSGTSPQSFDAQKIASSLTKQQLETISRYIKGSIDIKDHINDDEIITKLLNSESIQNVINNYNTYSQPLEIQSDPALEDKIRNQQIVIDELSNELKKMKLDLINIRNREIDVDKLKQDVQEINVRKIDHLMYQINRCCRKSIDIESHIFKSLTSYLNNPDFLERQVGLRIWLKSLFVAKTELEEKLSNLTDSLNSKFDMLLESNSKFLMDEVTARLNLELSQKYKTAEIVQGRVESDTSLTDQRIRDIVKDVLQVYDADKTGLVDYAMEPMGGQIITTRCTETYHTGTAVYSVLGIPLWYPTSSPRSVITPGMSPGKCWAFQNYPGLLVVKLTAPIKLEAFSLEHISKLLMPNGKIDSAPKDFEVYGLQNEEDRNGVKIGTYKYDNNGDPLQFFIAHRPDQVFEYIELRITSNHGNPNYTCLYRFRVHGKIQQMSV